VHFPTKHDQRRLTEPSAHGWVTFELGKGYESWGKADSTPWGRRSAIISNRSRHTATGGRWFAHHREGGFRRLIKRPVVLGAALLSVVVGSLALVSLLGDGAALGSGGVEIISGPTGTVNASDASFEFDSADGATSFECGLDGGAYVACSSPKTYSGLSDGLHTFDVRLPASDDGVAPPPAERQWTVKNLLPCTSGDQATNFPVYSLGPSVDGLDVSSITRRCDDLQTGAPARANYVSYVYGICPQAADGSLESCQAPLEIQTWPGCERSLADYQLKAGVPYPHEKLGKLDGVPAYSFDDGTRVELYTGQATIVIFATDPARIDDAVAAIELQPADEAPGPPVAGDSEPPSLPPPDSGALAGALSCG
jgi:hypothetical protein